MTQETGLETHMQGQCEARPEASVGLSVPTRWLECPPGAGGRGVGGAWPGRGAGSCPDPRLAASGGHSRAELSDLLRPWWRQGVQ